MCDSCSRDCGCKTGNCSWNFVCYGQNRKGNNGCRCKLDSDCVSGRCSKSLKCENKVSDGGGCFENDDCKSGKCVRQGLSAKWSGAGLSAKCSGAGAHKIKICAKEMILTTPRRAVGAHVQCWDKDPNGDDKMAHGDTGSDGCATLTYKEQSWDSLGGRSPDILCVVTKNGFVQAAPPRLDHHNQYTLAKLEDVTLYRDRRADAGEDNGCGPLWTERFGINDFMAWATRFRDQCTHHDMCYYDCQIFLASRNADEAQEFCDHEMYMGMKTFCHTNLGNVSVGRTASCLTRAEAIYRGLQAFGGHMAYDKSPENCPNKPNGEEDESMGNNYSHTPPLIETLEG